MEYGFFSLLPPVIAITLCFLTRNVIISLSAGVFVGCAVIEFNYNILLTLIKSFLLFIQKIRSAVASPWNAGILLQCLTIGGLIALITKSGGLHAIAETIAKKATSVRKVQFASWFAGFIIFFDDYANTFIVGPLMRPITDKFKISREKLAFIVDATAAPVAGMAIISTWIGYELSLIRESFASIGFNINPYEIFLQTTPYRFYNILILIFILFTIVFLKEFGAMYKAELRARTTGKVLSDNAKLLTSKEFAVVEPKSGVKFSSINALVPVVLLLITTIAGFYYNGYKAVLSSNNETLIAMIKTSPLATSTLREIFGRADVSVVLFQSALLSTIVSILLLLLQKTFTLNECIETFTQGMKSVLPAAVILVLAWSLSSVIKELGTAKYIVSILSGKLSEVLLPSVVFIVASIISFATGTSYGTMGILTPLVVPLAYSISTQQHFLVLNVSCVLTGAIFGDHCSPISDTTILSSINCSCDHMDHTNTQLLYAIVVALVSVFAYLLSAMNFHWWLVLSICIILLGFTVYIFGKSVK
ncbi:MAG: Na+/H+ antiporter NhaC family protein [Endomicrobia bacterium]|nr:Na+/H+ antiporter NhaC family protein [Endomicrobiia bacterium]